VGLKSILNLKTAARLNAREGEKEREMSSQSAWTCKENPRERLVKDFNNEHILFCDVTTFKMKMQKLY